MIRFEPFAALRYAPGTDLDSVIAPPYDVLSDADVDALEALSPRNIVHVDVPRGGADRYERAAATLADWVEQGVMVRDEVPGFTLYRMRFTDDTGTVGVLGALEVVDEGAGGVLPHERTTKKASTDRLDLTRATHANLSPVWGLSLAKGLTELLRAPGEPLGSIVVEGVEHVIERVTDADRVAAITELVGSDDVLIADGHHRYGVARKYRDEQREAGGGSDGGADAGGAELTLAFVGELVEEQLSITAIHRLYHGISHADLRAALERRFEIEPASAPSAEVLRQMEAEARLALVAPDGSCEWLTPRPGAFDGVRSLDGAWLEDALADVEHEVTYQDEVVGVLAAGGAQAAVLIRPVGIAEIERTAREGLLMPPKSTFFTPKLRTGFVVRPM